jgi:hypothetical protein
MMTIQYEITFIINFDLQHSLTSRSQGFLKKSIVSQPMETFPVGGARSFNIIFAKADQWILTRAKYNPFHILIYYFSKCKFIMAYYPRNYT